MNTKKTKQAERSRETRIRNALLAKVHIAKKDMGIMDDDYRDILQREFGVRSAGHLTVKELTELVNYFESKGWPGSAKRKAQGAKEDRQADALKERIGQELLHSDFTEKRLRGLVRKICGVDDLRFCHDVRRLKHLLAVLGRILDGK